jgi:hypothetical protein
MPAAAAPTPAGAAAGVVVAVAAPHTAAHPGERRATGRMQDSKAGLGTDSATIRQGLAAATATAAGDFRVEEEVAMDGFGNAKAPSSMADSTATVVAGAERFR